MKWYGFYLEMIEFILVLVKIKMDKENVVDT